MNHGIYSSHVVYRELARSHPGFGTSRTRFFLFIISSLPKIYLMSKPPTARELHKQEDEPSYALCSQRSNSRPFRSRARDHYGKDQRCPLLQILHMPISRNTTAVAEISGPLFRSTLSDYLLSLENRNHQQSPLPPTSSSRNNP